MRRGVPGGTHTEGDRLPFAVAVLELVHELLQRHGPLKAQALRPLGTGQQQGVDGVVNGGGGHAEWWWVGLLQGAEGTPDHVKFSTGGVWIPGSPGNQKEN